VTLVDMVGKTVRAIIPDWQPTPEPQPITRYESRHAGMGYCAVCGCKSFMEYLVWVDIGDNLGPRIRPRWLHSHDQCLPLLSQAYTRQLAQAHEWDFAVEEVRGMCK